MSLLCCCQSTPLHIHRMHKGTYTYIFQSTGSWAPSGAHCSLKLCVCVRHVAHSWSAEWPTYFWEVVDAVLFLEVDGKCLGSVTLHSRGSFVNFWWVGRYTGEREVAYGAWYVPSRLDIECHTHTQQVYMEIGVMDLNQNTPPQKCSDVAHKDVT